MVGAGVTPLSKLEESIRDFHRDHEPVDDDPKRLRAVIDALELEFSSMTRRVEQRGDHLVGGDISAASLISPICTLSGPSAAHRPLFRGQPGALPPVAEALPKTQLPCPPAPPILPPRV